jgi:hypothetical protein
MGALNKFAIALFILGACGDDGGPAQPQDANNTPDTPAATSFDLTFTGTSYTPHANQKLNVQVRDMATGAVVKSDTTTLTTGTFTFTWPDLLAMGKSYEVRWYADHNNNNLCNNPPEDHSWSRMITNVTADQTLEHVHDTNVSPVCDTFGDYKLTFTGSSFSPHNGQMLKAALLAADNSIVARGTTTVANGAFSIVWTKPLVNAQAYKMRFYADVNANGACDAPPTDHVWEISLGTATADMTHDFPHDTNTTNVCASFP